VFKSVCSIREKLKEVAEKFESREKIFGDEYQNRGILFIDSE